MAEAEQAQASPQKDKTRSEPNSPGVQSQQSAIENSSEAYRATKRDMYPSLYGTPSYSSMWQEAVDMDPGPGQYETPSSFGQQTKSGNANANSVSITAKHGASWAKVLISKHHALKAQDSPGPGSYLPQMAPYGKNVRFGKGTRLKGYEDFCSPGPVYDCRENIEENKKPYVSFTKDNRFKKSRSKGFNTGPGQYELEKSFTGQNGISRSFSVGYKAYEKVLLPGAEKANLGRTSPGPGSYGEFTVNNRFAEIRAKRKPLYDGKINEAVGPGSYNIDKEGPREAKACFSFGRPAAKARLNWKRQHYETRTWTRLGMAAIENKARNGY